MTLGVRSHPFGKLVESKLISCAYSRRSSGNMSFSYGDTSSALKNRNIFLSTLGVNYQDLVCAKQIHGSGVKYVKEEDKGSGALSYDSAIADTDAFVTDKKNLPLAVFTADCLPIFLYEPSTPVISLIHAGWRSSKENIAAKTVQLIKRQFKAKAENLYVGFGPAIRDCCYEVGQDFNELFPADIIKRNNRYYLDLVRLNRKQLLDSGVLNHNIFDSQLCTSCCNEDFFSYRKEGKICGRIVSVIMLK